MFIAHHDSGYGRLYGMLCTITGTTITVETNVQLSSDNYSGNAISAVKLDEGKVFIAHSYGSNYYLYGMVCTISGTTITKGTDTQLDSNVNTGKTISVIAINESKVFIVFPRSNPWLYSVVCTISGTSITKRYF